MVPVLLCLAVLSRAAAPPGGCPHGRLPQDVAPLCAVDRTSKLMLCSTAKAGATTISAIIVGLANKTAEYSSWRASRGFPDGGMLSARINMYRREVLNFEPAHRVPHDKLELCVQPGWLCIVLVRNPSDRLISSFLHMAVTRLGANWGELIGVVDDDARMAAGEEVARPDVGAPSPPTTFAI
jgi:hypothetical protein